MDYDSNVNIVYTLHSIEDDYYNHYQSRIYMVEKMIQEYSAFRKEGRMKNSYFFQILNLFLNKQYMHIGEVLRVKNLYTVKTKLPSLLISSTITIFQHLLSFYSYPMHIHALY